MNLKPTAFALLSTLSFWGITAFGQSPYRLTDVQDIFELSVGTEALVVDLKDYFALDVTGRIVQFDTPTGIIDVEMLEEAAPLTVENFLNYVERGAYNDSIFHRLVYSFVLQGGGFTFDESDTLVSIPTDPVVPNEYNLSNTRGTIAMAKSSEVDSATSQWFFNLGDNSTILDTSNNGGYTVFGKVIGSGMQVVDSLSLWSTLSELPLSFYDGGDSLKEDYSLINSVREVGAFPGEHDNGSIVNFNVTSDNEELVQVKTEDSSLVLTITPGAIGLARISIFAYDSTTNGPVRELFIFVDPVAPSISSQPLGRTIEEGMDVSLVVSASGGEPYTYEWYKNGTAIANSNSDTIQVGEPGSYVAKVTNSKGDVSSEPAIVTVIGSLGTLVNVSTRGYVGTGHQAMIAGVVVSGSESKEILLRGVSEGLAASGLSGVLGNSNIAVYDGAGLVVSNDNWDDSSVEGGLQNLFSEMGASSFAIDSKDSALVHSIVDGARTLILNGVEETEGLALVEVYDADQSVDSRIVNLSTRAMVKEGDGVAIVGFVIGGDGPVNVLIRGGSDSLRSEDSLQNEPILENPNLVVVSGSSVVAQNLDWDDHNSVQSLISIQNGVGAVPFEIGSNDSLLYLTLEPGIYSAVLAGGEGLGLVEIFEVR